MSRQLRSADAALAEIDEINDLCYELRKGYLKTHPDVPPTRHERQLKEWAELLRQQAGPGPVPRSKVDCEAV